MNEIPTPRTDAIYESDLPKWDDDDYVPVPVYIRMRKHAKELERELADAREQANDMHSKWLSKGKCCEHLGAELHEVKEQRDKAVNDYESAQLMAERMQEQRDRLAEALEYLCDACDGIDCADFMPAAMPDAYKIAREALAAVKGGNE